MFSVQIIVQKKISDLIALDKLLNCSEVLYNSINDFIFVFGPGIKYFEHFFFV